jgi:hypothetical protein
MVAGDGSGLGDGVVRPRPQGCLWDDYPSRARGASIGSALLPWRKIPRVDPGQSNSLKRRVILGFSKAQERVDVHDPERLRELASWYRGFAERAGNPTIWESRLRMAEDLDREAERIERTLAANSVERLER